MDQLQYGLSCNLSRTLPEVNINKNREEARPKLCTGTGPSQSVRIGCLSQWDIWIQLQNLYNGRKELHFVLTDISIGLVDLDLQWHAARYTTLRLTRQLVLSWSVLLYRYGVEPYRYRKLQDCQKGELDLLTDVQAMVFYIQINVTRDILYWSLVLAMHSASKQACTLWLCKVCKVVILCRAAVSYPTNRPAQTWYQQSWDGITLYVLDSYIGTFLCKHFLNGYLL